MNPNALEIAFQGDNAANFRQGFEKLIDPVHRIVDLSEGLQGPGERERYERADVIVGVRLNAQMPAPKAVRLFHAPAAGVDAIDATRLPAGATLANCFGHENAIAEFVMTALLMRHVPIAQADHDLRQGRWTWWAGRPQALRSELGQQTLGLLGFGHIAKTLMQRAKAFGMKVNVANRSAVADPQVDRAFGLDELPAFMASADAIVVTLPLTAQTTGLVGARELATMRSDAVILNVGRGPVIDEQDLYDALARRRIGGAVIDTWYAYPTPAQPECAPSRLPFAELPNVVMTPHMSGWTSGTVQRRQQTIAENIARLASGRELINVVVHAN